LFVGWLCPDPLGELTALLYTQKGGRGREGKGKMEGQEGGKESGRKGQRKKRGWEGSGRERKREGGVSASE